jgi:hypothetical protein
MKKLILSLIILIISLSVNAQLKVTHSGKPKELTVYGAKLGIMLLSDGRYSFSYTNGLKGGTDFRSIVFKNRSDAKSFIKEIGKAFSLKEQESNKINYLKYEISLSISSVSPDEVFMIVKEKGETTSVLDITKEMYNQINILR